MDQLTEGSTLSSATPTPLLTSFGPDHQVACGFVLADEMHNDFSLIQHPNDRDLPQLIARLVLITRTYFESFVWNQTVFCSIAMLKL